MSRYILIRRLRGPAFLLLVGVDALLNQSGILGWGQSWPFFLILAGALALAERAALASEGGVPPGYGAPPYAGQPYTGPEYPGQQYPGQPYAGQPVAPQPAAPETALVPTRPHDLTTGPTGGKL
jgi:hypothetical protein